MALIAKLRPGDELVVWKLDRLGRSLQDLLSILDRIHASGAAFRSLTEPIDTRTPAGKLMYSILGAVGEFERSIIRERAIAGQVAAYSRGKRWGGQKPAIDPRDLVKLYTMKDSGMYTHAQIAAHFGCSLSTVDRALAKRRDPQRAQKKRLPVLRRFLDGADPSSSCH
jgi:DNA invertase Pin-like site-specific DNA recombinase